MKAIPLTLCAALLLGACGTSRMNYHAFEGVHYNGRVKSSRADRKEFIATASPVSKGLDGARQAAQYEGIKHCVDFYGTSVIEWDVGPETAQEALEIDGETLTFRGRCVER